MRIIHLGLLAAMFLVTGCASIVSKSKWPVSFKSDPPGAQITVIDGNGKTVQQGVTPMKMTLPSGNGYFKAQTYKVDMKLDGYKADRGIIQSDLNGWYFGNIPIGGLIGMAIVDPLTGAMWRLPEDYSVKLTKTEPAIESAPPKATTPTSAVPDSNAGTSKP